MRNKIILLIFLILMVVVLTYMLFSTSSIEVPQAKIDVVTFNDNTFITQVNDLYFNIDNYLGKEIEIEGFPLFDSGYTFVSRFGPGCCVGDGIAYLEFVYNEDIELIEYDDWILVKGIISKDIEPSSGIEYLYIDATSVEVLDYRGLDTVAN